LKKGIADVVVIGEGEQTVIELLEAFHNKSKWPSIDGIAFLDVHKHVHRTNPRDLIMNLDSLPLPVWDLFPSNKLYKFMHRKGPFYPIITSRGCPFDCIHCTKTIMDTSSALGR